MDLTDRAKVPFSIPFVTVTPEGQPLDINEELTREAFDALTEDLADRTMETCKRVCADAGIHPSKIDHVLLVGGQTRTLHVQRKVTDFFGKAPSRQVNPDEAVAIGAAMYAYSFEDDSDLKVQVLDVIPMAIGIEDAKGRLHVIFGRNTPAPNLTTEVFTTSQDQQKDLRMRIYQGDAPRAKDNELLGEFTFSGIRREAAGRVRVEVAFNLTQDGILSMSARDRDTGAEMNTTVKLG